MRLDNLNELMYMRSKQVLRRDNEDLRPTDAEQELIIRVSIEHTNADMKYNSHDSNQDYSSLEDSSCSDTVAYDPDLDIF